MGLGSCRTEYSLAACRMIVHGQVTGVPTTPTRHLTCRSIRSYLRTEPTSRHPHQPSRSPSKSSAEPDPCRSRRRHGRGRPLRGQPRPDQFPRLDRPRHPAAGGRALVVGRDRLRGARVHGPQRHPTVPVSPVRAPVPRRARRDPAGGDALDLARRDGCGRRGRVPAAGDALVARSIRSRVAALRRRCLERQPADRAVRGLRLRVLGAAAPS